MLLIRHAQSEWNALFAPTRIDPGLADPALTELGLRQAQAAAERLAGRPISRIISSPYRRCLQTALIIAEHLGSKVEIDPAVRERCAYSCDQGTAPADLQRLWPELSFRELDDLWWGGPVESHAGIARRAAEFRARALDWSERAAILVVSHWGFVRALTGLEVENGTLVRYDPVSGAGRILPHQPLPTDAR